MQVQIKDGKTVWKPQWAEIGGKRCYYRSNWERRYALCLEFLKTHKKIVDWEHEPETFWFKGIKRGVVSYLPDFKIHHLNETIEYIEIKGYMDSKSATKIKRMAKYFPDIKLRVIGKEWFKQNGRTLKGLIKEW